jgi:hypothetical protein
MYHMIAIHPCITCILYIHTSHPCITCLLYIHASHVCYTSIHHIHVSHVCYTYMHHMFAIHPCITCLILLPTAEYHSGVHVEVAGTCCSYSGYLLLAPHTQQAFVGSYTTSVMTWASSSSNDPLLMMHTIYTYHICNTYHILITYILCKYHIHTYTVT